MAGKKASKSARSARSAKASRAVSRSPQRTVKVVAPAAAAPAPPNPLTSALPQFDFSNLGLRPARATGRTGLAQYSGYIYEEFLTPLIGQRAYDTYKEMSYNDATVGAMLTATEQLIHNTSITFKAADDSSLALKIRDLVETALFDMASSWRNIQSETMSFFPYGWSWQQVTYKKRTGYSRNPLKTSKHNDSLIGWADIMPHAQSGLVRWELDDKNRVLGIRHRSAPDHDEVLIPKSRSLHFRTKSQKWNPEGYALALDTPILTPAGWETMRSLCVGDKIFDDSGRIRYVIEKSEIWEDRQCYELRMSSGESIVADEKHLWRIWTANDRHEKKSTRLETTAQIYDRYKRVKHSPCISVGECAEVDQPAQHLPLDPYILGYWLGDGSAISSDFTVGVEDFPHFASEVKKAGYTAGYDGVKRSYVYKLREKLRAVGVLGNKHVPSAYLRGSTEQRLAVLQGLLDSDGSSPKGRVPTRFMNTNIKLVEAVSELVLSLGSIPRVTISSKKGSVHGKSGGKHIVSRKHCYMVSFWSKHPLHRLPRKLEQQTRDFVASCNRYYIRGIKKVKPHQTVCIQVDGPSGMFLAGKTLVPTHNSVLRNAFRPWTLKKRFEELEGVGIERDLTGLPILVPPEGLDLWNEKDDTAAAARVMAENIVRNVRVDKHMGLVLPFGWTFTLAASEGSRNFNIGDVISRYDQRIAGVMLADMILIGHERVGSFALIAAKMKLYSAALEGYDREISDVWNMKAIPDLVAMNGFDPVLSPQMKFGPIETPNLKELGAYVSSIKGGQVLLDRPLENHLRAVANFPPLQPGEPTTPDSPEAEDQVDEQLEGEGEEDRADAGVTPAMTGDIP